MTMGPSPMGDDPFAVSAATRRQLLPFANVSYGEGWARD